MKVMRWLWCRRKALAGGLGTEETPERIGKSIQSWMINSQIWEALSFKMKTKVCSCCVHPPTPAIVAWNVKLSVVINVMIYLDVEDNAFLSLVFPESLQPHFPLLKRT